MTEEALVIEADELLAEFDDCIIICRRELCALKQRLEFKEQELEWRKRSRPELGGYFYKFVPPEAVDPGFREEAEEALVIAAAELDLTDLPLKLRWFDNFGDQVQLCQDFRAGDLDVFSERKGLRGFISWICILETNNVNIAAHWNQSPIARVVAHELKHVQQRRDHGSDELSVARNGERERDADNYAADFWGRHWEKFRT